MTKLTQSAHDPSSALSLSNEPSAGKKAYEPPTLVEWGSLLELTAGGFAGDEDGDFSGSGGV